MASSRRDRGEPNGRSGLQAADETSSDTPQSPTNTLARRIFHFEHRDEPVASRRVFAARMSVAVLVWLAAALLSLLIGIAGYAVFEGMSLVDAFVSAAMVLSGMGEAVTLRTNPGKVFAGAFSLFSGLFMLVATGVMLTPIIHRVLHRFHVGSPGKP